jgi:predicted ATPase/class 3 adenylate cyclase
MSELPTGIVTFLFTDIQGSTKLLQELGDAYGVVQQEHQRILREAVRAGEGVEIRTEGDSFFVVFTSPVRAVRAAVSAQRGLAEATWPEGRPLRVRMGMHTGEGRVRGGDYLGIDVNRAARIAAAAHGGQVVVSEATRVLVEHDLPEGVRIRDLGRHRLKDLEHPERIYDLIIDGLTSDFPELKSLDARPNNLPAPLSSFIGREDDRTAVVTLLGEHRLVTLTGPGGSGKTRLSLRAAGDLLDDFPDGVFFVDLSPITDPTLVPSAIALVLGLSEQADRSPLETMQQHLRDLRVLLVLDNFEQVVSSAQVVQDLLDAAPEVRVLATSRIPLHLYGEQELAVPPLALPDPEHLPGAETLSQYEAVALFIDRARAARQDFAVTNENAPAVAEICVRLDGLPLAIELAASRVKLLSPEEILSRLGHRLPLLTGGAANLPERQRTLKSTIEWSFDLLNEPERRLFARLAAFAGGFTLPAADAVANPEGELGIDTLDGVSTLADNSLLRTMESVARETRFGMLETIHEYATERLAETEEEAIRRRQADYVRALAEEGKPHFTGEDSGEWLDRFEREHDNVRAALRWAVTHGEVETALRMVGSLWRFWFGRGHLREGYRRAREVVAMPGAADHPAHLAAAEIAAGGLAYWLNDLEAVTRHYGRAGELARGTEDQILLAEALTSAAYLPMIHGDYDAAQPLFEEALEIARSSKDPGRISEALHALGYLFLLKRDLDQAESLMQEAIEFDRTTGNRWMEADGLASLVEVHMYRERYAAARTGAAEAVALFQELANMAGVGMMLETLAGLTSMEGNHDRSMRIAGAGKRLREEVGGGAPPTLYTFEDPEPAARAAIGDEAVDRALQEGRAMDVDDAVAYALQQE